jgi:thiol-disulfide isomerase/thioredoxin/acetyl esterase/lipase
MRRKWLVSGLLIVSVAALSLYLARDTLFFTSLSRATRANDALREIRSKLNKVARNSDNEAELRQRCLTLARDNPGTQAEISALYLVAGTWPQTSEGEVALERLKILFRTASLDDLGHTFQAMRARHTQNLRPLFSVLVDRVETNKDDPSAARILTEACIILAPAHDVSYATDEFRRAADLIVENYVTSPEISNFCEVVGGLANAPSWGLEFEPHMCRILDVNQDRFVRCSAKIALASIVRSGGRERQQEARQLFEQFLAEFDGKTEYHASSIEQQYRHDAQRILDTLRTHGLGAVVPDTVGIDLAGQPISLAEYRGKIVLVSFWATWCYPCMKAIPYEKELYQRFGPDQFTIVGVNADRELGTAQEAVAAYGIPWRSFQVKRQDGTSIANDWHIAGYPTLYLLNADGTIVGSWLDIPSRSELEQTIGELLGNAIGLEYSPRGLEISGTDPVGGDGQTTTTTTPTEIVADLPGATGFVSKILLMPNGRESKYVVFIPKDYDDAGKHPAILFLHGAGAQGTDGLRHITALAKAINRRKGSFPFIVVFPQAPSGDWQPESGNGELAIAALDDVLEDYSVDADRVALTGISMGGEGTWSLAAAYPDRWSAIVPLCGGGNPETVPRFSHIPCWCFQGEADEYTAVLSREMVRALREAGGQPIYVEYANVGHNCWDLTYARTDLFEWLTQQRLKRK